MPRKRGKGTRKGRKPHKGIYHPPTQIIGAGDPDSIWNHMHRFTQWQVERDYSGHTIDARERTLRVFAAWAAERGLIRVQEITRPILERWQRHLFLHRKGKKDRVVPIGARALQWIDKYLADVRPDLACGADDGTLFLSTYGQPLGVERVAEIVREAVNDSGIGKKGSCHMFRHTMATLMLENGADVRFIQAMLGHADLKTTELYTQVSIKALKAVHTATHPARPIRSRLGNPDARHNAAGTAHAGDEEAEALLALLDAEAEGEDG